MSSSILSNLYSKFSNQSLNSLESKKLLKNSSSTNNSINSMNSSNNSSNNTDMEIPITPKGWKVEFDPVLKQFFYINLFNNLVQLDHPDEVKTTPPSTPSASSSSSLSTKKFPLNSSASSASSSSSSIFSLNDSQNPKKWYNKLNLKKSLSCNKLNQHKKSIDSMVSNATLPEEQEERSESFSDSHYSLNEEFDPSYESDNTDYVDEIQPYFLDDDNESNYILDYGSKNVEIDGNNEYIEEEEEEEEDQYESNLDYLNELKNLRELMAKENNIYKCQSIHGA